MHKIYSRFRIRIPKITLNARKKFKNDKSIKRARIVLTLIIAFSTAKLILDAVSPIFDTLCENKAESITTMISNEQATLVMKEHTYDELFQVEKDSNGNIVMIKSNVIAINEIISDVAIKIQQELDTQEREDIEIAIGSFTGFKLLSGRGPGVKIRISSIGNVETDLKSEFISQGINQTLHRIYLQIKCQVNILTPFDDISKDITNQVLLAENVIVGNIPDTYYDLEGLQSNDAMEVMP